MDEKENEIIVIPKLLDQLDLNGALVSIDAIACNPAIAEAIVAAGADYLLPVKRTSRRSGPRSKAISPARPRRSRDRPDHRQSPWPVGGSHLQRLPVDRLGGSERAFPGAQRFPKLATIAMIESRIEKSEKVSLERRYYISSRPLSAEAFADAARSHWGIENRVHWVLDVTFREDLSRLRIGHGAHNMAVVRHFALNLVRQVKDKRAIKRRRKVASWNPEYLTEMLQLVPR